MSLSPNATGAEPATATSFSAPSEPPPLYDSRPLPAGWVKEFDSNSNRNYYVDTLATPPRSIWVHPLDDPEFTRAHQLDGDDDLDSDDGRSGHNSRPPSAQSGVSDSGKLKKSPYPDEKKSRRNDDDDNHLHVPSTAGASSSSSSGRHSRTPSQQSVASVNSQQKKRGFFGKLKDELIGTKEERAAAKAQREARRKEEERLYYERRDAMMARRLQEQEAERQAWERAGRQYQQQRQQYGYRTGPPQMNAYGGPTYQDPYTYGASPYGRRGYGNSYGNGYGQQRGGGSGLGGGAALAGGLIGGLLLGDLLF